jgi:hypothetical protein
MYARAQTALACANGYSNYINSRGICVLKPRLLFKPHSLLLYVL